MTLCKKCPCNSLTPTLPHLPRLSPLARVLRPLSLERVEAGSLWGRRAAGRGLTGSTERGPATPPSLEAALFVSAPEADPAAVPAARRWRLAVIVTVFMPEAHLEEKLNWCDVGVLRENWRITQMYCKYCVKSNSLEVSRA